MRLRKIQVKNYRTLEDINLSFSSDYCTISGKNNAGKSCIIRLIINLLSKNQPHPFIDEPNTFDYKDDYTQWMPGSHSIKIISTLCLTRKEDTSLIAFIEKIAEREIKDEEVELTIKIKISSDDKTTIESLVDGEKISEQAAKEILTKLRGSNCLFLHNSTTHQEQIWYRRGRLKSLYEVFLSTQEQKTLEEAGRTVQGKIKRLAKEHRNELNEILGKLAEKYDVEFSTLEGFSTRRMPFTINLKDKNVEVPLNDWGSGTQNRTYILISILQANRIKTRKLEEDKITPIVILEEPESFLHPSAQAEFGRLLNSLSSDLGIQIIVSTHSPYMLNQEKPEANILLRRKINRQKLGRSEVVDTRGKQWMEPFAEHLGIMPPEFDSWRKLFASHQPKALLVEGDLDKSYFEYLREKFGDKFLLPSDVEIVPYGGKGALGNMAIVKFMLSRFDKAFVTFDLDAAKDVVNSLKRAGLIEGKDFTKIGIEKSGKQAIEGLLPDRVISNVISRESDLVMQAMSQKSDERNEAKRKLKNAFLEEFKKYEDYTDQELRHLTSLGKTFKKCFE